MTKGDAPNRKLGYLHNYTILIASFLFWKLNLKADFGWKLLHIRIICRTINKYFAPTVMSKLSLQVFQNSVWKKNNKDYVATPSCFWIESVYNFIPYPEYSWLYRRQLPSWIPCGCLRLFHPCKTPENVRPFMRSKTRQKKIRRRDR